MSVSLKESFNLQTSASLEVSIIKIILSGGYCCAEERDCGWVWEKVSVGGKQIGDILIVRIVDVMFVRRGFEFPSRSSQQKQVERRAAEDAVPLQRPHLRGQDRGPEALLHQGSLPCSYNHDHYRPHQQHYHDLMFSRKKSWTAWWGASLATPRPTLTRSLKSLGTQRRSNMSRKRYPHISKALWCWSLISMGLTIYHSYHMYPYTRRSFTLIILIIRRLFLFDYADNQEIICAWSNW